MLENPDLSFSTLFLNMKACVKVLKPHLTDDLLLSLAQYAATKAQSSEPSKALHKELENQAATAKPRLDMWQSWLHARKVRKPCLPHLKSVAFVSKIDLQDDNCRCLFCADNHLQCSKV